MHVCVCVCVCVLCVCLFSGGPASVQGGGSGEDLWGPGEGAEPPAWPWRLERCRTTSEIKPDTQTIH